MHKLLGLKIIVVLLLLSMVLTASIFNGSHVQSCTINQTPLDPNTIPKYISQLVVPPVYKPVNIVDPKTKKLVSQVYTVDVSQFQEQILPSCFPKTTVWGYGGQVKDPSTGRTVYFRNSPGATFEAVRGIPITVNWINKLTESHLFAVDPTLHWANPNGMPMDLPTPYPAFPTGFPEAQKPVPIVTHLHGGEVPSVFDGGPDAWFTSNGKIGPSYVTNTYTYPNAQEPTTLWYHDHALGITRINVYAGLAGFYLLRDSNNSIESMLPNGKYEIPLAIQDRSFNTDGSLMFDNKGINPDIHPYWNPEFFGNTIMVNGKVWPNLNVERKQYRFRILNGSNARFYNLTLSNGQSFTQIGSDGGFLPKPVSLTSLLLAPGERADILIDFSMDAPGTKIVLRNDANAPYPGGNAPDQNTSQIMQFTVPDKAKRPSCPINLPKILNDIPKLTPDSPERILTLNEVMGQNGPLEVLLNGQKWESEITETPKVGATEDWKIVNLTGDTHPIHLHLVQFQVVSRQQIQSDNYTKDWIDLNGEPPLTHPTIVLPVDKYLIGDPTEPPPNEQGWKDTVKMNPGEVTTIRVRFAPQDAPVSKAKPGVNLFPFDPTVGPGYVWHCHILDHEDNEMMRPYVVTK